MKTLVSVIIPVHNRAHIVSRTLDSVASQIIPSETELQVIIVDDCSTDSEKLLVTLKKYSHLNIVYTRHKVNLHGAAARNTGVELAVGEYIAFLDSDDEWYPEKLMSCLRVLQTNLTVDGVYSRVQRVDGSRKIIQPTRPIQESEEVGDYLLFSQESMQTSSIVVKKEVAKRVRWNDALTRFQDYDFCIRLYEAGYRLGYIDKTLVRMLDVDADNRISQSLNTQKVLDWLKMIRTHVSKKASSTFLVSRFCRYSILSGNKKPAFRVLFTPEVIWYCNKKVLFSQWALLLIPNQLVPAIKRILRRGT